MGAKETHLKILWSEGAGAKKKKLKKKYSGQQHHRNVVLCFSYYTFLAYKNTLHIYTVRKAWPSISSAGCFLALGES